jgi:hypothetical protein
MGLEGHLSDGTPHGCDDPGCVAATERSDRWLGPHLSLEPDGRAHFHHRSELRSKVRADHDAQFAELAQVYDTNPSDFVSAFNYLTEHPLFHRPAHGGASGRTMAELTPDELVGTPEFVDDGDGLRDMWMHVSRDENGAPVVYLEHGPHLWPQNIAADQYATIPAGGTPSHDVTLDVEASTYEQAIVALAAKVRERYGHNRSLI